MVFLHRSGDCPIQECLLGLTCSFNASACGRCFRLFGNLYSWPSISWLVTYRSVLRLPFVLIVASAPLQFLNVCFHIFVLVHALHVSCDHNPGSLSTARRQQQEREPRIQILSMLEKGAIQVLSKRKGSFGWPPFHSEGVTGYHLPGSVACIPSRPDPSVTGEVPVLFCAFQLSGEPKGLHSCSGDLCSFPRRLAPEKPAGGPPHGSCPEPSLRNCSSELYTQPRKPQFKTLSLSIHIIEAI